MALARKYSLPKKDFDRVFKQGKTVRNSFFFIRFMPGKLAHARVGVTVARQAAAKAVERNRLKRIITESVRQKNFYKEPLDFVIVVTYGILEKSQTEIKRELDQTINRILRQ